MSECCEIQRTTRIAYAPLRSLKSERTVRFRGKAVTERCSHDRQLWVDNGLLFSGYFGVDGAIEDVSMQF